MLKAGVLMLTMLMISGCASIFGEDPGAMRATQQVDQVKQVQHDKLQAELERLRAEVKAKKELLRRLSQ